MSETFTERLLTQLQRRLTPEQNCWIEILKRTPELVAEAKTKASHVKKMLRSRKFPERVIEAFLRQLEK